MKKRKGNGPMGEPHPDALLALTCELCKKEEPTYMHGTFGPLCPKCWRKITKRSDDR